MINHTLASQQSPGIGHHPSVGIVTPAYNAALFIGRTLESVLRQSYGDWEMVIVDDGSSDHTADIVQGYIQRDHRIQMTRQKNAGVGAARNAGLAYLSQQTEYVIFLDQDDVWREDALEKLIQALQNASGAAAVFCGLHEIDENDRPRYENGQLFTCGFQRPVIEAGKTVWKEVASETFEGLASFNRIVTTGMVLIRRSALDRPDPWDTDRALGPCVDYDFFLNLSLQAPLVFVSEPLIGYRKHGGNVSADKNKMQTGEHLVWLKYARNMTLGPGRRRIVWDNLTGTTAARMQLLWAMEALQKRQFSQGIRGVARWMRVQIKYPLLCFRYRALHPDSFCLENRRQRY